MGRGSAGNVIAALCSFFIPGLGQLLQGRWILAGFMFVMSIVLWSSPCGPLLMPPCTQRRSPTVPTGATGDTTGNYSFMFKTGQIPAQLVDHLPGQLKPF